MGTSQEKHLAVSLSSHNTRKWLLGRRKHERKEMGMKLIHLKYRTDTILSCTLDSALELPRTEGRYWHLPENFCALTEVRNYLWSKLFVYPNSWRCPQQSRGEPQTDPAQWLPAASLEDAVNTILLLITVCRFYSAWSYLTFPASYHAGMDVACLTHFG